MEDMNARVAELQQQHRVERVYSHIERIAITLFALALLCFPLTRRAVPTWTKCVLIAAAAAGVVELLLLW